MKLLAFSVCTATSAGRGIWPGASEADVVIAAGDFASIHEGLEEMIDALRSISTPGRCSCPATTRRRRRCGACEGWDAATVLHGQGTEIDGTSVLRVGGRDPDHPVGLELDLDEDQASERLADCPEGAVLVVHSPPKGHCDQSSAGDHLGSEAILRAIEEKRPTLAVCGHIHESWGARSEVGPTKVVNLGPAGQLLEV